MCSREEYNKWESGELLLDRSWKAEKQFITKEEAIEKLKDNKYNCDINFDDEDEVEEAFRDEELYTSEKYFSRDLETYESSYTTKNGEEIVAFGYFGYDG
jgi:hypothetical protein